MSGVVAIAAAIVQYMCKRQFNPGIWVAIGAVFLFNASYQAWSDQRAAYLVERCKVDSFENRSATKSQLAIFMKEAEELSEELTKDSSPSEVKDWFSRTAEWENNVSVWAKANLGDAAEAKVSNKMGIQLQGWTNQISPDHGRRLSALNRMRENIGEIIGSSEWDDFADRVASSNANCDC
jgi:hypothetical protein